MFTNMKKFFFIAGAALVMLVGCTKSEIMTTDNDLKPIAFENFIHKTTKANEADETTVEANGFGVSAFYTNTSSTTSTYFENIDVSYTTSEDRYKTSYYWPLDGTMAFYAVYPKEYTITSSTKTIDDYTTEGAVDLMVATALNENCATHSSTATPVAMAFSHTLTQIYFEIKGEEALNHYLVEKIVLEAKNGATYTYGTGTGTGWSAPSTDKTYTYYSTPQTFYGDVTTTPETNNYVVYGTKAANSLMLIPQSDVTVKVYYTVKDPTEAAFISKFNEDDDTNHYQYKSFVASSSTVTTDVDWASGKTIKYQLTLPIGAKPIEFTASVADWTESSQTVANSGTTPTPDAIWN